MILEELGDLLPQNVQTQIVEVMGSREPGAGRPGEPTAEDLVAETHFENARTVLGGQMAERLGDPDLFLPPAKRLTGPGVYRAMSDSSRWIRRVLQKRWWPRPDRPIEYAALTSPRGYDSVYRHWQVGGTSFLAQSTYGWLELSLRANTAEIKDPKLAQARVEWRLRRAVRMYIADPHKVLRDAAFELRSARFGYDARLRLDADLVRKLNEADRQHELEWLRRMTVQTNGTSFVFRFEPKTNADGRPRENRRQWFAGSTDTQQARPTATDAESGGQPLR
jgi:hypothetical protein